MTSYLQPTLRFLSNSYKNDYDVALGKLLTNDDKNTFFNKHIKTRAIIVLASTTSMIIPATKALYYLGLTIKDNLLNKNDITNYSALIKNYYTIFINPVYSFLKFINPNFSLSNNDRKKLPLNKIRELVLVWEEKSCLDLLAKIKKNQKKQKTKYFIGLKIKVLTKILLSQIAILIISIFNNFLLLIESLKDFVKKGKNYQINSYKFRMYISSPWFMLLLPIRLMRITRLFFVHSSVDSFFYICKNNMYKYI